MKSKAIESYRKLKQLHPDYFPVVLLGDFYETFHEEAEKLAKIAGLTVTTMNKWTAEPVPMVGFPSYMTFEITKKLQSAGYKGMVHEKGTFE
ncbi:MAG TPA: hypothetical protein VNQ76_13255 [Planctomicrobium sp.]|nr:hypothetical protein [Planctomicrobium sp.]